MVDVGTCSDACGWTAGIIAALAYGSFGVPVRYTKQHIPDVHPLVLQSFKTITMFVLSFPAALVIFHVPRAMWTWWGLVSGMLWVLGGTGGIYAIRLAGLAVAVGTWASVMIAVNFAWGILVFREPVHDVWGTLGAFLLLSLGLVGMSIYAAPPSTHPDGTGDTAINTLPGTEQPNGTGDETTNYRRMESQSVTESLTNNENDSDKVLVPGTTWVLATRQAGIAGAVLNGLMTGSSLIPMHYAKAKGFGGANYLISMATGSLISNIIVWMVLYAYQCHVVSQTTPSASTDPSYASSQSIWRRAYDSMPLWYFSQLVGPGVAAGVLLSIAMFGSILSVTYLGQGIGNSIVQTKILVSGVWGICWFGEIRGWSRILSWLAAASLTVLGVIWLSLERLAATNGAGGH